MGEAQSPRSQIVSVLETMESTILVQPQKRRRAHSKCIHERPKMQCGECGGCNICEHDRRRTRCRKCWENGNKTATTELCIEHGKRIGACGVCIRNGVQKPFKHTPCPHMKKAYMCPQCKDMNRGLHKVRTGKLRVKKD